MEVQETNQDESEKMIRCPLLGKVNWDKTYYWN